MVQRHADHRPGAMRRLLMLLGALLLGLWPLVSAPQGQTATGVQARSDPITERVWLDDPAHALTPAQALAGPWKPYSGVYSGGYSTGTTWLRVRLDPGRLAPPLLASDQRLVLRIEPGHLDELTMWRTDGLAQPLATVGDTAPVPTDEPRWLAHSVVIPQATAPFEILMRVRSQGTHIVHIQALRWDEARDVDARAFLRVVAFLVFMAALVLWSGMSWISRRDAVLGLFILHQLSAVAVVVLQLGVVRFWSHGWLPPRAIDFTSAAMIPAYTILILMFHVMLLRDLGAREPERSWLPWTVLLPLLGFLAVLVGLRTLGLQLAVVSAPLLLPVFTVVAWRCQGDASGARVWGIPVSRIYGVMAYLAMSALTLPQALAAMGLRLGDGSNFEWFMSYSLVSSLLLGGLLRLRAAQMERQRQELTRALADARRQEQVHSARAAEQSELVTMLVHELKTPLSVISLGLGRSGADSRMRERAMRAVTSMRDLIDRCAQIARLDHSLDDGAPAVRTKAEDPQAVLRQSIALQTLRDRVDYAPSAHAVPVCFTDRQLLLLVLNNLLDNAIKYGAPDAPVRASIDAAPRNGREGVAFVVANAVGRAGRPDAQRLFEKYHRSPQARYRSGSGLGLYLSRRLAIRLGGELTLLPGEDVRFELWIPCGESALVAAA